MSKEAFAYKLKGFTATEMQDLYVFASDDQDRLVGTPVKIRNKLARKFYETQDTAKHFKFVREVEREYPVARGLQWNCTVKELIPTGSESVADVLEKCEIVGYVCSDAPVLH
jgi:hypothetical protein